MRRKDLVSAIVLLGLAISIAIEARNLSYWAKPQVPGPGFLPFWLAVGLAVGAVGILIEGRLSPAQDAPWFPTAAARNRLLLLALLTTLLIFGVWPLGMLVAIGLYLLLFLGIFMRGRWPVILTIAIAVPLAVHLLFERWLMVPLPHSAFGF